MMPHNELALKVTRRELLQQAGMGIGGIALASLLDQDTQAAERRTDPLAVRVSHFPPRAKNVIFVHMVGAPSHLDLYDFKPVLQKHSGEPVPKEYIEGERFAFLRGHPKLLGTEYKFKKHGQGGVDGRTVAG
jgi:hypothetical protein